MTLTFVKKKKKQATSVKHNKTRPARNAQAVLWGEQQARVGLRSGRGDGGDIPWDVVKVNCLLQREPQTLFSREPLVCCSKGQAFRSLKEGGWGGGGGVRGSGSWEGNVTTKGVFKKQLKAKMGQNLKTGLRTSSQRLLPGSKEKEERNGTSLLSADSGLWVLECFLLLRGESLCRGPAAAEARARGFQAQFSLPRAATFSPINRFPFVQLHTLARSPEGMCPMPIALLTSIGGAG